MADSGMITMPADNETIECIAPMATTDWCTLQATGHKDIQVFVYTSGVESTWSDEGHWVLAKKLVVGHEGAFYRVPPAPYFTVRAQGPVSETVRVTVT